MFKLFDNDIRKIALQRNLALEMIKDDFAEASRLAFGDKKDVAIKANMIFGNLGAFSNVGALKILLENSVVVIDEFKLEGNFEPVLINSSLIVKNMYNIIKKVIETRVVKEEIIKEIEKTFIDLVAEEYNRTGLLFFSQNYVMIYYDGNKYINKAFDGSGKMGTYIYDNGIHKKFPDNSFKDRNIYNITSFYTSFTNRFNETDTYDIYKKDNNFLILLNMLKLKSNTIYENSDITEVTNNIPLKFLYSNTQELFKNNVSNYLFGENKQNEFKDFLGFNIKPEINVVKIEPESPNKNPLLGNVKTKTSKKNPLLGIEVPKFKGDDIIESGYINELDESPRNISPRIDVIENISPRIDVIENNEYKIFGSSSDIDVIRVGEKYNEQNYYNNIVLFVLNKNLIPTTVEERNYFEDLSKEIDTIKKNYYISAGEKMSDYVFDRLVIRSISNQNNKYKNNKVILEKLLKIQDNLLKKTKGPQLF